MTTKLNKNWTTHMGTLIKAIQCSTGDVIELGGGPFSTPLLHWLCKEYNRKLTTYDNDPFFYKMESQFQSDLHRVRLVKDWNEVDVKKHYGLVFIDQHPSLSRSEMAIKLKDSADYIVLHDTEPQHKIEYNWDSVWPNFKYVYHWQGCRPWTSVVSNFNSLINFK